MYIHKSIIKGLFYCGFLIFAKNLFAQPEVYNEMKQQYPDKMAVVLKTSENVIIDIIEDDFSIYANYHKDVLHLNENANALAKDKVYSSHFMKVMEVEAKTMVPNKNKYKAMKVKDFVKKNEQTSGIFYDDMVSTSFVYPAVQPMARTVLDYQHQITDPRVLRTFFFDSYIPINESELTVKVNKKVKLNYKLFNVDDVDIDFSEKEEGNYRIYRWHTKQTRDVSYESDAPGIRYFAPHMVYYIEEVELHGEKRTILKSASDLYKWYHGFVKDVNVNESQELKKITDEIVNGIEDEEEKVKRIFYWVQDNIKYIAFEDGMKGLIPQSAALVCEKRYGDCKGMASIVTEMLSMAGISGYLTWVGSRDLPYKYSEVPSPIVDNHMIAAYNNGEKYIFLDATGRHTPYGFPTSMIQGKETLIGLNKNEFVIEKAPIIPKEMNYSIDSLTFYLKDNKIIGEGMLTRSGYPKIFNAYRLDGLTPEEEKEIVVKMLEKGNNKFFVDDYTIKHLSDRDVPLQIPYEFRIEDYFKEIDNEIYINLNLNRIFANDFLQNRDREVPVEHDYKYTYTFYTSFVLPQGYEMVSVPQEAEYENELFGFSINYEEKDNRITQVKVIYMDFLIMDKQHFNAWDEFIKALNSAYREALILKRKN